MTKQLLLSSAYWMNRNMLRRIELSASDGPGAAPAHHWTSAWSPTRTDGLDAWDLQADGRHLRVANTAETAG
jgi:polyphosphate kinase